MKRIVALLLVFVLILGLVPAVSAQATTPDLTCLDLAEADCALLKEATANAANIKSFEQSFSFSLKIGGIAALQPGAKDMAVTASGSGPLSIDPANMAGKLDIKGSVEGDQPQSGEFNAIIADGKLFVKNPKGEWIGVPLEVALSDVTKQMGNLPVNPSSAGAAAADPAALNKALEQMGLKASDIENLVKTPGFLKHEKLADTQVNGVTTSPFAYTIDFAPLFNSADFEKMVNTLVMEASKNDPQAAQVAMFLPLLKQSKATIKVTQYVSPADKFVHQFDLDINAAVDLSALMGGGAGGAAMSPITVDLKFSVALDKINEAVTVAAPEGAKIATTSDEFSKLFAGS